MRRKLKSRTIAVRQDPYQAKRRMLLETAARAFNERGFYQTSLDDIAAELNVTKAALYYYFKSKDEILYECHSLAIQSITDTPLGEIDDDGLSGLGKIERLVRRYVAMIVKSFGRCLVLVGTQPLEPENAGKCRAGRRGINDLFVEVIREGIADGSIAPCDPKLAAYFLFGTLNWIAQWYDEKGPRKLEEITDQAVGYVLGGLATPGGRAAGARRGRAARDGGGGKHVRGSRHGTA